ncbi:twin-arginine translocase TatA/TatE family subunit [Cryobacterium sp. TMT1-3]|uniref:Sec-independent protein translocase protein TatA n=1 Tax=Cryobacterium luteum TaxID=1424661 RepID=A0A1H8D7S8_9MICO|nr:MULTISPECIES: twin-arginine translocase TatA/TatE family subunit [Cryobacterium]TFB91925.1 twin-arginine translocase TatA/TatE family subunit [Cryobacterium luteum]TFC31101.1 twin-arginine translocase TatA/TatE family subunit [Cryobacterium sp. TMT1-3]SEN03350.1 sec-independent protein translocase protein TatA [Cryobacterium luteum]
MLQNLTGWHFLIILVVVLLLFGAPKLPGLARSLGQSMKIFKSEIKSDSVDPDPNAPTSSASTTGTDASKTSGPTAAGPADPAVKP